MTMSERDQTKQPASPVQQASRWMYRGMWTALIRWFRVPEQPPDLPAGRDEQTTTFQPDDGFLKYLKLWFWIVAIIIDLAILIGWIIITVINPLVGLLLAPVALAVAILPDIIGYIAVHLRFDTTWYVMTDRAVRIRRGVWAIHETTITYDNVQNVKLTQGPVQRACGIASVLIETAGAGGTTQQGQSVSNQGLIEGIADAAAVRDRIMARARLSQTTGLGDDAAPSAAGPRRHAPQWSQEHLAVLREIRDLVHA